MNSELLIKWIDLMSSASELLRRQRDRVGLDASAYSERRQGEVHQQEDRYDGYSWMSNAVPAGRGHQNIQVVQRLSIQRD